MSVEERSTSKKFSKNNQGREGPAIEDTLPCYGDEFMLAQKYTNDYKEKN